MLIYFLYFLIFIIKLSQCSTSGDNYYVAGVVEFNPISEGTPKEKLDHSLTGYGKILENYIQAGDEVDIIVFPEAALNHEDDKALTFVPNPEDRKILCNNSASRKELLVQLSCWAKNYQKYMIFNLYEKAECTKKDKYCQDDGLWTYNTNVVFGRNGALIARYRKYNLYNEPNIKPSEVSDLVTFETDFGVRFGTFICFDILFADPSFQLTENNVSDIVYPTMWFSESPFLTANQIQFAWSYANDVNFLVAGANHPALGNTGTGIFAGKLGTIKAEMFGNATNKMIIAKVPKKNQKLHNMPESNVKNPSVNPQRLSGLHVWLDPSIVKYKLVDLNSSNLKTSEKICYNDFCCNFKIRQISNNITFNSKSYEFKLGAFADKRPISLTDFSLWNVCAVISCTDSKNVSTCGSIFDDKTTVNNHYYFDSIEIETTFKKSDKMLIVPTTLDQMFSPLNVDEFNLNITDYRNESHVVMTLTRPNSDLLTFGTYAMYYDIV